MNDHWNVLYQVSVFYADRKSKMATIAGHRVSEKKLEMFTDDRQQTTDAK
jgi:hypothetical protein